MKEQLSVYTGISNSIVLAVDDKDIRGIQGRVYHAYSEEAIPIACFEEVIRIAENLFNDLGYPQMATNDREFGGSSYSYRKKEEMVKVMDDKTLLEQQGDLGTFIIRVQHRQHSSWQGKVTWIEENETVNFRSALELMKMIDHVLEENKIKE
jgi:hypothetical protein